MFRRYFDRDRPFGDAPLPVTIVLVLALMAQLIWHGSQAPIAARAEDLPQPLSPGTYIIGSLGEPIATAKVLNLWLQAFDNQPGLSLPLHSLDYSVVIEWLDTILELDPDGHYPMLVAARVYGSVSDRVRQREMMAFIFDKFSQEPEKHWRWLAHAVIVARHELKDMPLALKYANALADKAAVSVVPYWAKDMRIMLLEDMDQVEAAKALVGGLIVSGEVTDPHELDFLKMKLAELEDRMTKSRQDVDK